jgi:hypothetical protein
MNDFIEFATKNYKEVIDIVAYVVLIASLIVKLTPTLKDYNILKPIIKFVGKIALNKILKEQLNSKVEN